MRTIQYVDLWLLPGAVWFDPPQQAHTYTHTPACEAPLHQRVHTRKCLARTRTTKPWSLPLWLPQCTMIAVPVGVHCQAVTHADTRSRGTTLPLLASSNSHDRRPATLLATRTFWPGRKRSVSSCAVRAVTRRHGRFLPLVHNCVTTCSRREASRSTRGTPNHQRNRTNTEPSWEPVAMREDAWCSANTALLTVAL